MTHGSECHCYVARVRQNSSIGTLNTMERMDEEVTDSYHNHRSTALITVFMPTLNNGGVSKPSDCGSVAMSNINLTSESQEVNVFWL